MDEVECAECSNRYDSDENAFCPRCGNMGEAAPPAVDYLPQRFDPARRRAKAGGVVLAIVGGLAIALLGSMAIVPPEVDDEQLALLAGIDSFAQQPGGDLHLRLVANGTALESNVTVTPAGGRAVTLATQDGWVNLTGLAAAFGNITVASHGLSMSYYVPGGATVTQSVDVERPPEWVALRSFGAVRVLAAFMAFFAGFVLLGGVMAILLKAWRIALAASIVALVPGIVMVFLVPVAGLLFILPPALALLFIVRGRRHFA